MPPWFAGFREGDRWSLRDESQYSGLPGGGLYQSVRLSCDRILADTLGAYVIQ